MSAYNRLIQEALQNRTSAQYEKHCEIAMRVKRTLQQEAEFKKVKDISAKFSFPIKQMNKAADKYIYV